ncbi:putative DNA binding domain-containing protein [Bacteroides caecigallinarum]|uniref:RNA-binding domain-containing protein n=1 Tax=unclassified Bacteroides TaxID=2646097 RepID=UPI0021AC56B8|nr:MULTISPECIES: RNA-binding domain-containing protein [unclassified Bacteroides]MCR8893475.1 putative DNA binding domain-containing protein [Bacteroides sp. ET336]MDN0051984.1 putative DNA binding domain-containing protein [Bacteroides caecigallinarum]MDN0057972.1 putative DNA binding domain-containing protein [Bacteroides caecigallinarum]MDN0070823.1 putative DNA binding domain-containing protein [Bacteroides caecigallinarum]
MLPTDEYYIQKLIDEGEHVHQDFKFAISDARKIAKSISAFSNTEGGRLLVGVKDNGKIAGVRSEEEIYMIEAAAKMYCTPEVNISNKIFRVQGKDVLEVSIEESKNKPVCAIDENNKPWAYVRINDENILADTVFLNRWKHNKQEEKVIVTYSEREKYLLDILSKNKELTLNQCSRLSRIPRITTSRLLADFIRFDLVEQIFREHTFYFRLKEENTK